MENWLIAAESQGSLSFGAQLVPFRSMNEIVQKNRRREDGGCSSERKKPLSFDLEQYYSLEHATRYCDAHSLRARPALLSPGGRGRGMRSAARVKLDAEEGKPSETQPTVHPSGFHCSFRFLLERF